MGKVRIYDLAKELKLESKKVLEDARRLGVDASVPSNTVPDAIAAKIREMYYPKKEIVAAKPAARLIKHHPSATAPAPATSPESEEKPISTAPARAEAAPHVAPEVRHEPHQTAPAVTRTTVLKPLPLPAAAEIKPIPPSPQPAAATQPVAVPEPPVATPEPIVAEQPRAQVAEAPIAKEPEAPRVVKLPTPVAPQPEPQPVAVDVPAPLEAEPEKVETIATPVLPVAEEKPMEAPAPEPAPVEIAAEAPPPAPEPAPVKPVAEAPKPSKPAPVPVSKPHIATTASGTKVIKLAMPTKPLPLPVPKPVPAKPVPGKPAPAAGPAQKGTGKLPPALLLKKDLPARENKEKEAHLLPSGAQQRTVYIPPQSQKPKGRNQHRGAKDKEKGKFQEGNAQKLGLRKNALPVNSPRALPVDLKALRLVEGSTVREFAEKMEAKPRDVVAALMQRGVMATINQIISHEMATDIGREYGFDVSFGDFEDMSVESEFEITPEAMDDTDMRAPVITVMGHVDHGKTSLLDGIRSARVAEGEAGGITQHIGAYSVEVPNPDTPDKLRRVVFLDTPGHEAFTMMRARGAKVTDIVVLVVAADDGVMPQTVEAIEHARAAKVPIIVAINKIDKPDANPDRVRKELADRGLLWSNWGGETEMVEVSAKKRQNLDGLLEMILLTADILDLKSNPKRRATGTVLEAKLDRGRGAVATVLVQNGSLRIGDPFIVGSFSGRVRALVDDRGARVQETGPATPVEVLGLEGVPSAGDQFLVVDDVAKAQQIAQFRQAKERATSLARTAARGLDQLAAQMQTGTVKELLVILKADVQGSVEVLKDTLVKLSTDKVKVRIIRSAVGAITYDDVLMASASQATESGAATVIIGFNVRPESRAEEVAKQEGVDIRLHSIIYKVEEEVRNAMLGLMDATSKETVLGKAEIRDIIRVPKVGSIAGCLVTSGSIKRTAQARLIRSNVVIFESAIGSLRRFKEDVSEVQQNYECGITIERFNDYKLGDVIEAFIIEKVAPTHL
ncbi:MAG TPA: translation initiation factor IF-2 [Blastocatellia bacterium]|nr:translation initiation factor IF-2 [Blastocatellia bacterium]HMZ19487.1 translation initiation factor IF-2 [Blastocatellia bacterium]HNG31457.1 translation initiation factor IF-2 [Blastocatellia bacterium]